MEEESEDIEVGVRIERTSPPPFRAKKMRWTMKVVVVIYEGGRIPGAAEEGAAAGEVIGEGEQNRWWQYNAPMWHCTATVEKSKRVHQHAFSQWRSRGTSVGRVTHSTRFPQFFVC